MSARYAAQAGGVFILVYRPPLVLSHAEAAGHRLFSARIGCDIREA